jgi:hypothetical protein
LNFYTKEKSMRKFWLVTLMVVVGLAFSLDYAAAKKPPGKHKDKVNAVARLAHSGDIKGVVQCPAGTAVEGALVYLPGHSFMAKTNVVGEFRLYNVPAGTYRLVIEPDVAANPFIQDDVEVLPKRLLDLGSVDICPVQ